MNTEYAIIITDENGQRRVCTKDICGQPFKSSLSAIFQIFRYEELFPHYKYDWAPVMGRPFAC